MAIGEDDAAYILALTSEFSEEFGDSGHTRSNYTQATRLLRTSGLGPQAFVQRLYEARSLTRDALQRGRRERGRPIERPMAFYFSVLRDVLGLRTGEPASDRHRVEAA